MEDTSSERSPLGVLAEEFVERYRRGQRPSLTEYAERAPELADEIRSLFPTLVEMEQLKPVTGDHTGPYQGPMADLERLGEFRILRRVGVGGMGVVYEAVQESLGRHVALKVLPSDALADPKRLERFRREAKAAAKLHHTNIVPVFGTGAADGRHYYAMQFITGHPLDAVVDEVQRLKGQGPTRGEVSRVAQGLVSGTFLAEDPEATPPAVAPTSDAPGISPSSLTSGSLSGDRNYWATVARIGEQVASALAYAHGQGVLHRDIKPANLLLDLHGTVWVADFGLAKAHDSDGLTHAGDIVGTLRYMAPERFDGGGDHRADVYALGLTLYELLTLKPAFNAENRAKLVEQVVAASPPNPRSINPAIPRDLETIVLKSIAHDPAMRYQSASELAEDLRRYQEDRPIAARRASRFEQARRWCRRNPAVAGLIAGLFLVFAAGAGVSALFAVRAERNEAEARQNADDAQRNADDAQRNAAEAKANLDRAERSSQQAARNAAEAQDNARSAMEHARQAAEREKEAIEGREKLRVEQEHSRRLVYASKLREAGEALNEERIPRVRQILDETRPRPGEPDLRGWEWHYLNRELQPPPAKELRLQREPAGKFPAYGPETSLSTDGRFLTHSHWTDAGVWFEVWDLVTFQRVGRVPETGAIAWTNATLVSQEQSCAPVLSPDGKHLAAVCPADGSHPTRPDWRVRIWEVATGRELDGPKAPPARGAGQVQLGAGGERAVWVEAPAPSGFGKGAKGAQMNPPLNQSFEIARWTREAGKIDRKRIQPAPGPVDLVVAPDGGHAVAFPRGDWRIPSEPRPVEFWDLSGDTPRLVKPGTPRTVAGTSARAVSAGAAIVATSDGRALSVDRFSDGGQLWQAPLTAGENFTARTILGVGDEGRRVVFAEPFFLRVVEKAGDDKAPVRQWTVRHDGAPGLDRVVTADGRRLVTVARGARPTHPEIVVRVTDLSRNTSESKPTPEGKIKIERVAVEGPAPDRAEFVVRDAAGREYGRVPDTVPVLRQSPQSVGDDRYLLANFAKAGDRLPDLKTLSWKLFKLDGPGAMPLVAGGAGVASAGLSDGPRVVIHVREPNDVSSRPVESLWVFDPETGTTLRRIGVRMAADERLEAVRLLPTTNGVLAATRVFNGRPGARANEFPAPGGGGNGPRAARNQPEVVTLRRYDPATGKEVWTAQVGQFHPHWQLVCNPDGREAYCTSRNRSGQAEVHVARLADGVVRTFRVAESGSEGGDSWTLPHIAGVAPGGRLVIVIGEEVQFWDCGSGQLSRRYLGSTLKDSRVTAQVRFSTDGRRMVVAGTKLHVWDLSTDRELLTLGPDEKLRLQGREGHFSFDGNTIVVGTGGGFREFNGTPEKP